MIRRNPRGDLPQVSETAFVDPTAILCGPVIVEDDVFIGPYAVIRADETDHEGGIYPIRIGAGSNIQDGVVVHSKSEAAVTIGRRTSIAHRSIIHGPCTVGDEVFVGFNSVLFNCTVGNGAVIRHNAVVEDCHLPFRSRPIPDFSSLVTHDPSLFLQEATSPPQSCQSRIKRILRIKNDDPGWRIAVCWVGRFTRYLLRIRFRPIFGLTLLRCGSAGQRIAETVSVAGADHLPAGDRSAQRIRIAHQNFSQPIGPTEDTREFQGLNRQGYR